MTFNIIFWLIMFIALFGGMYVNRSDFNTMGGFGINWILLALLGWKVYPIVLG